MRQPRSIRFGTGGGRGSDPVQLISLAQRAEEIGCAAFGMADHFMTALAPLVALQAIADATEKVRLTHVVLAQDFRHPAVLAKELATLDVRSGGRHLGAAQGQQAMSGDSVSRARQD
jgi:alkanesulfonate monooxygenase SsuD/methylene tetrahydromethanopterin reductase-like flavin-dependent oxidoreductase (luciferase family)